MSKAKATFVLCTWDGRGSGSIEVVPNVTFDPSMKPEGITRGKVGGKKALVVVDDEGGFAVLPRGIP